LHRGGESLQLFRFSPESLLELVRLDVQGPYRFESITVKSTEKRFDGYFKSDSHDGPDIFLEIQGYRDHNIYWRLFREICAFHEERETGRPFAAIVLFIDKSLDPGNPPLIPVPPNRLIRCNLIECLKTVETNATPLVVLKPLALPNKTDLPEKVGQWKAGIDEMGLPESRKKTLVELLEYAILHRFKTITLEEIRKMIQLTPLEETVAVKELMQESMEKGELVATIQMTQKWLKRPLTPKNKLYSLGVEDLKAILADLEAQLPDDANGL
jgi:predicted transposase YdaD